MSRNTAPLTEDPRWTPELKAAWDQAMAELPQMWNQAFDSLRGANISRWCDYGEHDHCRGEVRPGVTCMCAVCKHV